MNDTAPITVVDGPHAHLSVAPSENRQMPKVREGEWRDPETGVGIHIGGSGARLVTIPTRDGFRFWSEAGCRDTRQARRIAELAMQRMRAEIAAAREEAEAALIIAGGER